MYTVIESSSGISFSKHKTKAGANKQARFMSTYHGRLFVVVRGAKQ